MKKLSVLAVLILATSVLGFGTTTVSGKLSAPNTSGATPGYVYFQLENCGGNYPVVNGASITPTQKFTLANDGTWTGTLYKNDEISCNGDTTSNWWHVTYYQNGLQVGPARDFRLASSNCNTSCAIDGLTPLTVFPTIPSPTGDNTYLRLDGGNAGSLFGNFWGTPSADLGSVTPRQGFFTNLNATGDTALNGNLGAKRPFKFSSCDNSAFASTAACQTDASTTGGMLFPPSYAVGTFTNSNNVPVLDLERQDWRVPGVLYGSDYGIVADCSTDNTTQVGALITRALALGFDVQMPRTPVGGCFKSGNITITLPATNVRSINIYGAGRTDDAAAATSTNYQRTVWKFTDATGPSITINGGGSDSAREIKIHDMTLVVSNSTFAASINQANTGVLLTHLTIEQDGSGGCADFTDSWIQSGAEDVICQSGASSITIGSVGFRARNNALDGGNVNFRDNVVQIKSGGTGGFDECFQFGAKVGETQIKNIDAISFRHNTVQSCNYGLVAGLGVKGISVDDANHFEAIKKRAIWVTNTASAGKVESNFFHDPAATDGEIYIDGDATSNAQYGWTIKNNWFNAVLNYGVKFPNPGFVSATIDTNLFQRTGAGTGVAIFLNGVTSSVQIRNNVYLNSFASTVDTPDNATQACDGSVCEFRGLKTPTQMTSTVSTGTAPFAVSSTTPVANLTAVPTTYNSSGTQQTAAHIVFGVSTLSSGTFTIALSGAAVFTSNATYVCTANDEATTPTVVDVQYTDGSHFVLKGTGVDVISWQCIGN